MLSLTLNNFGCYYKKVGKPNVALSYMLKALTIEQRDEQGGTRCSKAGTKLNICAILSSQSKHRDAIVYAKNAIADYESLLTDIEIGMVEPSTQFEDLDMATLLLSLSIAFYNLGAEYEHCKEYKRAQVAYEKSLQYAAKAPPEVSSQMLKEASRSIREVVEKDEKQLSRQGKRLLQRLDAKGLYPPILPKQPPSNA
jgi:tetratricopeptide (TPR) repeat protein